MNPKWLENKIIEMSEDIKELKELLKVAAQTVPKTKGK
jgi:uncharacterized ferredoxin-like protein